VRQDRLTGLSKEYLKETRIKKVHGGEVETGQAYRLSGKENHRETRLKGMSNK